MPSHSHLLAHTHIYPHTHVHTPHRYKHVFTGDVHTSPCEACTHIHAQPPRARILCACLQAQPAKVLTQSELLGGSLSPWSKKCSHSPTRLFHTMNKPVGRRLMGPGDPSHEACAVRTHLLPRAACWAQTLLARRMAGKSCYLLPRYFTTSPPAPPHLHWLPTSPQDPCLLTSNPSPHQILHLILPPPT